MDKLKEKREEAKRIRKGEIKETEPQKDEERMKMLTALSEGDMSLINEIPQDKVSIILKKNEICYATVMGAQLWEDRAVRKTDGGYGGFGFHVAKGVTFHIGKFGATAESQMERRHQDTGNLFVTNKRFVFVGNHKNIDFPLDKILAVEPFSDGIGISRANKQKTEYFIGGFDGLTVKAAIEGAIRNL